MADFTLVVGIDPELSFSEMQSGINGVISRLNAKPYQIKVEFDKASLTAMQSQMEAVLGKTSTTQKGASQAGFIAETKAAAQAQRDLNSAKKEGGVTSKSTESSAKAEVAMMKQYNTVMIQGERNLRNWSAAQNSAHASSRTAYAEMSEGAANLRSLAFQYESGALSAGEFKSAILAYSSTLKSSEYTIRANGDATKTFSERLGGLAQKFGYWLSASQIIMYAVRSIRQMISASVELDSAMTQMQIVTKSSAEEMRKFGDAAADAAQRSASKITDIVDSATTYARLGYDIGDSTQLAEYTAMLQNVGDIEVEDAQNAITAIIKAYDVDASQIEAVMNKLVETGNNFPISVSQIAEGMNNASSALSASGNSFEESVALLTAANTTIQDAARSSTGLRTIAARIRNTKTELDDLGEVMTEANYEELVSSLTKAGVSLTTINGEYRSTYDIMSDIASKWGEMTSMEQAAMATALSGTRQQAVFYSIIEQFQEAEGAMDAMAHSAGALDDAYSVYMDSAQAHINQFKATFEELSSNLINSSFISDIADMGSGILEIVDGISAAVNAIGGLNTVLFVTVGIIAIIKADTIISKFSSMINILYRAKETLTKVSAALRTYQLMQAASRATTGTQVISLKNLSAAFESVGLSISVAQIAMAAFMVVVAAASIAYSQYTKAQQEAAQAAEELRNKQISAASEAKEESNNLTNLINNYIELSSALENGTGSKEEFLEAQEELIDTLNIEQDELDTLIKKYGSYSDAIRAAAIEKLKESERDLQVGKNANADALVNAAKDAMVTEGANGFSGSMGADLVMESLVHILRIVNDATDDTNEAIQALNDSKLFSAGFKDNLFSFQINGMTDADLSTADGVLQAYYKLGEALDIVAEKSGTNSSVYKILSEQYSAVQSAVKGYENSIGDLNSNLAEQYVLNGLIGREIPTTKEGFDTYRQSVIDAAQSSGEFAGSANDIESSIDAVLKKQVQFARFFETDSDKTFVFNITTKTEGIDNLNKAISESASATGLTTESITELENRYSGLEGHSDALENLFERTSNGIHLNAKALDELEKAYAEQDTQDLQDHLQELKDKYNDLTLEIDNCSDATERNDLYQQREDILSQIKDTAILISQYDALTSSYNAWQSAQSATDQRDQYSKLASGYDQIKELIDAGWYNDSEVNTYLDTMLNASERTKDNYEDFQKLTKNIEGTSYSIADFFQLDDDNNLVSDGLFNFLDTVKAKLGDEYVKIAEDGSYAWDFTGEKIKKVAEELGMSTEAVGILEKALNDVTENVNLDTFIANLDGLQEGLTDKVKDLENALGDRAKSYDFSLFNFGSFDTKDIENQITNIGKIIDENFKDKDGNIDLSIDGAEEAVTILASLVARKQELNQPAVMSVDTSQLTGDIESTISQIQTLQTNLNNLELGKAVGADTTEAQENIRNVADALNTLPKETKAKLGLDTTEVQKALDTITGDGVVVNGKIQLPEDAVSTLQSAVSGITPEMLVNVGVNDEAIKNYNPENKKRKVTYVLDSKKVDSYDPKNHKRSVTYDLVETSDLKNFNPKNITRTVTYKITTSGEPPAAQGTAHATGSAFASGNWGIKGNGIALGGEVGQELVVRNGRFFTIGDDGAEFFHYKHGDIVFNAEQTRQILMNGKITNGKKRGVTYADGTAFGSGSGAQRRNTNNSTTTNRTTTTTTSTKNTSSSDTGSTVKQTEEEIKSALDKFKDWLSRIFDWVEIRISRQAAKIDKYISKADIYVNRNSNISLGKASANYRGAISATATQIQNESRAASIYNSVANNVLKNAKAKGLIDDAAINSIKKNVANGTMVISKYSDKYQEIIKSYQTWINKSKDASEAILDLQSKLISYVKTLKDVRDSQRELALDKNSFKLDVGTSGFTSSSGNYYGVANTQLNYQNSILSNQNKAYDTEVTNVNTDLVKLRSGVTNTKNTGAIDNLLKGKNANGKGKLKKALNKKVKGALKNAKAAMSNKKKVADADMNIIKSYSLSLFEKIYAYNLALDNLDLARQEQALNYAQTSAEIYENIAQTYENQDTANQNTIDLNKQRADNETSAQAANAILSKNIGLYNDILTRDATEVQTYSDKVTEQRNVLSKSASSYRAYAYKNLGADGKKNVDDLINTVLEKVKKGHGIPAGTLATAADYYSKGYITQAFYQACVDYNNALEHKREAEAQQQIDEATIKADKEALGTEMLEKVEKEYENKLDANQRKTQQIESQKSLTEARRGDIDEGTYNGLISQSKEREGIYLEEINELRRQIQENLSSGIWDESSQAYLDALQKISDYEKEVVDCQVNQEELKVSLRDDVYWRTFERAHDAAKRLSDVLSGINDLVSDDMLYDSEGNMTEFGLVRLSTLSKQYDAARKNVTNYMNDIDNLNKLYEEGKYTELEYTEKLGELEDSLLSESSTMKSVINDILEYYKTLEQKELDGLSKIIDARKKALDAKKEYYDYDKTLKSKNKDIQFLRAQVSALEGIEDMSARAKRAQLQAQLTEAEDELNDIVTQHQFELSSKALDGLKETMQEAFDDRWADISSDFDAITELLNKSNILVASQSDKIAESLGSVLSFYGIGSAAQTALNGTIAREGYATGVKSIGKNTSAWTQDGGREFIIRKSDGAILTPLKKGDSVIPNKLTENLFAWGSISPDILSSYLESGRPTLNIKQPNVTIDNHYDALLNIEGNVDSTVVTDVKKFAQQFYEGAYEFTKREIVKDARKLGVQ